MNLLAQARMEEYTEPRMNALNDIERKMEKAGLSRAAIDAFKHSVETVASGVSGMIPEEEIIPAENVENWETLRKTTADASTEILAQTVVIKLNGGLGTSMGLQKAKSLLPIQNGLTFLDLIVKQIQSLRQRAESPVRLLLMNSFSTSRDTLDYLSRYATGGFDRAEEVEIMQNRAPKLLIPDLTPASFPKNPELEWCPPGHGDLYPSLLGSGWLDRLLAEGVRYAFISNSDNLGAQLDLKLLNCFVQSDAPFMMEVTRRTEADKKGGHLASRKADGQLVLREVAQCPSEDLANFQDIDRHRYFNTNNLWLRLDALKDYLTAHGGVIPLPVIRNVKTLDPRDPSTPKVYQLEVAMGAAIECFKGARAICVPRTRFFPVKTTADLFILRSDAVQIGDDGSVTLAPECNGKAPLVSLDARYKFVDALDSLGIPSLKNVHTITVKGQYTFSAGEPLSGDVILGE